ncbi:MAG: glycosyltransferase family 4 protein [Alphaproteobacteria bacterium]
MHIMVLTDRFAPEVTAVPVRTLAHAKEWVARGHRVTVVTCVPNAPRGQVFDGYKNVWRQEEWMHGIRVIRIKTYLAPNAGSIRRVLDYSSFMASAIVQSGALPRPDILVASSPPITVAMAGALLARRWSVPWVFELRDLWPASIKAVGASSSPLLRLVERMELGLYRSASRVLALTHSFKRDLVERGIDASRIDVVTNGVDATQFLPGPADPEIRAGLGVPDTAFLAGYVGTVGMAHGLSALVAAAERLKGREDIHILIQGEGAERAALEQRAREAGLTRLHFRDFVPHGEIARTLRSLDLALVHLKKDPVFETVIPSKIFELMALGVPILMGVEGESAGIIAEAQAGLCVEPENVDEITAAIAGLADNRDRLAGYRSGGLEMVRTRYDRRELAKAALACFEKALDGSGAVNVNEARARARA